MEYDYSGEKFLERLFNDLYLSEEVQHTSKKDERKEVSIKKYMDRLDRIHKLANTEEKKEILKQFYYRKYVINENNIPSGLDKKEIIEGQKKRLSMWIDYLTDENAKYPMWAKYWAFQGMLKLGTLDEVRGIYQRRTKETIAPFVEANPEIIAQCIDNMINYIKSKQTSNNEIKPMLETGSFKKLYEYYEKKFKNNIKKSGTNIGKWVKYNEGSKNDAIKLCKSLENKSTGWCTASEGMAINQVCGGGGYPGGDFYVYYTLDENNEYTNPRIAIRMEGKTSIGEIRGIAEHQNLEEEMIDILESKLNEMTFIDKKDVYKNIKIVNELRELYQIYRKYVLKEELNFEELMSLYTKKYGFGWENDPTAIKIKTNYKIGNKKTFLEVFKQKADALKYASKELLGDKEIILKVVRQDGKKLFYASEELQGDKEVVLEAIKKYGYALEYASEELQRDKEVVLEAVKQDGKALIYASEELQGDKEVVLEAVKQAGEALCYASEELKRDKEVVIEAVRQDGYALECASEELRNDKEVVLEAVKQDGYALEYASEELQRDKEVVLEAIKQNGRTLKYASEELQRDKEVILEAVRQDGEALRYASEELQRNKKVVIEAVRQDGFALYHASKKLQGDKEVVLEALKQNVFALKYVSEELRNDKDFIILCVHKYPESFKKLIKEFENELNNAKPSVFNRNSLTFYNFIYDIAKCELDKMAKSKFKDIKPAKKVSSIVDDTPVMDVEESDEIVIKR